MTRSIHFPTTTVISLVCSYFHSPTSILPSSSLRAAQHKFFQPHICALDLSPQPLLTMQFAIFQLQPPYHILFFYHQFRLQPLLYTTCCSLSTLAPHTMHYSSTTSLVPSLFCTLRVALFQLQPPIPCIILLSPVQSLAYSTVFNFQHLALIPYSHFIIPLLDQFAHELNVLAVNQGHNPRSGAALNMCSIQI